MNGIKNNRFFYSQVALATYQACQLKFRRRYLEKLYWPRPDSEQMELGNDFHLASERYFSTGHVEEYPGKLDQLMQALVRFRPLNQEAIFLPEQELRLNDGPIRLLAKYDLIMLADKAYIYDWKTDQRKLNKSYYDKVWQTIVYRYLLSRSGSGYWGGRPIRPADIVMVYWNPIHPEYPLVLEYSERRFKRDEEQLRATIAEIDNKDWDEFWATSEQKVCQYCEYSPICHGVPSLGLEETALEDIALNWDDIEEFPF